MNVRPATTHPQATQEIQGMIDMIQTLIDKGYAYNVDGTVYFRTRKFTEYGKLSHKNLDDLRSGSRSLLVTGEDQKEDPLDFVLWKPKKRGRALLAGALERRQAGLAYRMLRDGKEISGRGDRHPRRRRGSDFSTS